MIYILKTIAPGCIISVGKRLIDDFLSDEFGKMDMTLLKNSNI